MWEELVGIIKELPLWMKILGVGWLAALFILLALYLLVGSQVVHAPSTLEEIKENATTTLNQIAINATADTSVGILSVFGQVGEGLTQGIENPAIKNNLQISFMMAGILFVIVFIGSVAAKLFRR